MDRIKVSLEQGYTKWAPGYDAYPNPLTFAEEPLVRRLVGPPAGRRVLDAACGTGRHAVWLRAEGADVTAIDPSAAMLAVARSKRQDVDWRAASLPDTGLPSGSFDVAVCALAIEHFEDLRAPLAELCRVLGPRGALVISAYHPFFLLKGVPPHFAHPEDGVEYELTSYPHLPSAYFAELRRLGMRVTDLLEPLVDDAMIAYAPNMAKHRGLPVGLVLRAER
jgi:ubiquinone/menaquinone biosynthesis C-methylase UbiE